MFVKYPGGPLSCIVSVCLFSSKSRDTFHVHFVPMVLPSCSHAHVSPDLGTAAAVCCCVCRENTIMGPSTKVNNSKEQPA